MGAGLGPVDEGQAAFMMITFTGQITGGEADKFNVELNKLLKAFNDNAVAGGGFANLGSGHVDANMPASVVTEYGS
jgi:hypothetical protein